MCLLHFHSIRRIAGVYHHVWLRVMLTVIYTHKKSMRISWLQAHLWCLHDWGREKYFSPSCLRFWPGISLPLVHVSSQDVMHLIGTTGDTFHLSAKCPLGYCEQTTWIYSAEKPGDEFSAVWEHSQYKESCRHWGGVEWGHVWGGDLEKVGENAQGGTFTVRRGRRYAWSMWEWRGDLRGVLEGMFSQVGRFHLSKIIERERVPWVSHGHPWLLGGLFLMLSW